MLRMLQYALLLVLMVCAAMAQSSPVETIDRIAATVNGRVIMASDVQAEMAYECLLSAAPCASGADAEKSALDRLMDRELVREQGRETRVAPASSAQISDKLTELRTQLKAGPDAEWQSLLARSGLSEEDVRDRIEEELNTLGFIDARFRPAVHIELDAIEQYYKQEFVPHLPAGAQPPELRAVSGQIREILTQQAINKDFDNWMASLRSQSEIEVH